MDYTLISRLSSSIIFITRCTTLYRTNRGTKRSLVYARDHTVQESLSQVKMWNSAFLQSEDLFEAMRAAMAKETATYPKN